MANVVLVDASVWIGHFNGAQSPPVDCLRDALEEGETDIIVGDLITQEVLQGFRLDAHFTQAERALAVFPCVMLGGRGNCIAAAKIKIKEKRNRLVFIEIEIKKMKKIIQNRLVTIKK